MNNKSESSDLDAEILAEEERFRQLEQELALDLAQAGLDTAGILDPTPTADLTSAGISLYRGDLIGAGLSTISAVPYVGDLLGKSAKMARTAKKVNDLKEALKASLKRKNELLKRKEDVSENMKKAKGAADKKGGDKPDCAVQKCSKSEDGNKNEITGKQELEKQDPDTVIRQDDDFRAKVNSKGHLKSHLNENDDLVPSNITKNNSITGHVRGGTGHPNINNPGSQYTSTIDLSNQSTVNKTYGKQEIEIDVKRLQQDISSGKVEGVEVISHTQLRETLKSKVDKMQKKYNENPTNKNYENLEASHRDLKNAIRDGECLIKGCVPKTYIRGPYPTQK